MISVCMSTYNGERFLKEQIDSIITQLKPTDELIISDDGSTDATLDIIKSYRDDRIKLLHHKKVQQKFSFSYTTANIKNALKHASGDIIFLADQDDVWLPNKLKLMTKYCGQFDLIVADSIEVDRNLQTLCESHFELYNAKIGAFHNWMGPCCYLGANMCFKKDLMKDFMDIPDVVPHDLWIGLITNLRRKKMLLLAEKTMLYRRHDTNVSGINNRILRGISNNRRMTIKRNDNSLRFRIHYRWEIVYQLCRKFFTHS